MANGQICVLYSPSTSVNGAKLPLNKGPPRKATIEDMSDAVAAPTILTPHALPMFRDGDGLVRGSKRKREKERMDPRKSKRPELPVTGPGRGGRVGASATQHVVQNLVRDTTRDEDVRVSVGSFSTSLLRHLGRKAFRFSSPWTVPEVFFCVCHGAHLVSVGDGNAAPIPGGWKWVLRLRMRRDCDLADKVGALARKWHLTRVATEGGGDQIVLAPLPSPLALTSIFLVVHGTHTDDFLTKASRSPA